MVRLDRAPCGCRVCHSGTRDEYSGEIVRRDSFVSYPEEKEKK